MNKSEKNYLTLENGYAVRLHGFEHVTDHAYIYLSTSGRTIALETTEPEQDVEINRFRVSINNGVVKDKRFHSLIDGLDLAEKRFVYNEPLKNYFPTNIKA